MFHLILDQFMCSVLQEFCPIHKNDYKGCELKISFSLLSTFRCLTVGGKSYKVLLSALRPWGVFLAENGFDGKVFKLKYSLWNMHNWCCKYTDLKWRFAAFNFGRLFIFPRGRRGPSVHLQFTVPKKVKQYFLPDLTL